MRFENEDVILDDNRALAMGNYFFTGPDGSEIKVDTRSATWPRRTAV